jgi:hypothetical protein
MPTIEYRPDSNPPFIEEDITRTTRSPVTVALHYLNSAVTWKIGMEQRRDRFENVRSTNMVKFFFDRAGVKLQEAGVPEVTCVRFLEMVKQQLPVRIRW